MVADVIMGRGYKAAPAFRQGEPPSFRVRAGAGPGM